MPTRDEHPGLELRDSAAGLKDILLNNAGLYESLREQDAEPT